MEFIELQQSQNNTNNTVVRGPIFVSIGSVDQLNKFLEQNPKIPADQILVDDYDHNSYKKTMAFERFDEITSINQLRGLDVSKLVIPLFQTLGVSKLLDYVQNVPSLAPVEGDLNWRELPEGGLRNGGTIVLRGGNEPKILYRWNDKIPGDVPDPSEVYKEASAVSV
mmetsp:Transcript_16191/g.40625  ORF Transcript_16191/g.40625 Transcript_16191/m.40625 type:complete len:167 (-) Transcript_16191:121-621(-)